MQIGIPAETKPQEGRIALIPQACAQLVRAGHNVYVEKGAGCGSGYSDAQYESFGVEILGDAAEIFERAELIVKVKEPIGREIDYLQSHHTLFCYLHLAANEDLTSRLVATGLCAIAFETVSVDGHLPLLAPMSNIAGRIAVQVGTHLLHQPMGGRGVLLGGIEGTETGHVVILGGGVAGGNATRLAAAGGAQVTVFDRQPDVLAALESIGPNVTARAASEVAITEVLEDADLLIGAVLIPGARAPRVVSTSMIESMKAGSVVVDISVDQGGCIETTRPTTYDDPVYTVHGVMHFCVTNMPGAVPRTGSQALSAAITPYVEILASDSDWKKNPALKRGINIDKGNLLLNLES